MPQINETLYAPPLDGGEWVQRGPVNLRDLRGKAVVLIDFWDYTCVNCLGTLPYVAGWHGRYERDGLVVVGVHAPEFSFARDRANVAAAIRQFGLDYPIVLDNGYAIWRAYSNRYWPSKYLVDAQGRLRYYHFGEGSYQETEIQIQKLLHELNPTLELPPPIEPVRDRDRQGAVCYRVTPELYLGYARGQFGNPTGVRHDKAADYVDPGRHVEGAAYLSGGWTVGVESATAESAGAMLSLRYTAMDVNLVLAPPAGITARLELVVADDQQPGRDVEIEYKRNFVNVDRARMYNLVANQSVAPGALQLKALDRGISAYAFTFVSCVVN